MTSTPAVEQASNPTLGSSKPSLKKALSVPKMGKKSAASPKRKEKKQKKTTPETDSTAAKPKSFRRIRGFITGESRRERRARKAAERAAAGQTGPVPDDEEETVYGVGGVDAESVARSKGDKLLDSDNKTAEITVDTSKKTPSIQVILLLMDGVTRRFELLQLEFDSTKAIVSDLLKQIPHSVTEEALRKQNYKAVCDRNGTELINSTRLNTFCTGSAEILVAVPEGMLPKEVARLSKPILSDEKVIAMLKSSGIDYAPVEPKKGSPSKSNRGIEVPEMKSQKKSSGTNKIWAFAAVALLAVVFQVIHVFLSSPLKPNQVLSPGITLHEAGLLSLLPFKESSSLEMGTQGTMTLYGPSKEIEWQIFGATCPAPSDDGCRNGAVLDDAGDLLIGGKAVTSVHVTGDAPLSPWPFEKAPKLRVVRVRG